MQYSRNPIIPNYYFNNTRNVFTGISYYIVVEPKLVEFQVYWSALYMLYTCNILLVNLICMKYTFTYEIGRMSTLYASMISNNKVYVENNDWAKLNDF